MSEMSFDDAVAALQSASDAEQAAEAAPLTVTPQGEASGEPSTPSEAAEAAPKETPQESPDSFIPKADLDSLLDGVRDPVARERIERAYKSFQGDYTRKTQEVAEARKAYEDLGDPAQLREALEFQNALRDPNNWPSIHQELTNALIEMGMSPVQARAEAQGQMEAEVSREQAHAARPDLSDFKDDPELAPVAQYLENMEERFSALTDQLQAERQQQQAEQMQLAVMGELTRQENAIRQANPNLTDQDMAAVYEMASFYGGNLFQAKDRLDQLKQDWIQGYVDQKGSVQDTPGIHPFPGGGSATEQAIEPTELSDKEIDALAKQVIDQSGALETF